MFSFRGIQQKREDLCRRSVSDFDRFVFDKTMFLCTFMRRSFKHFYHKNAQEKCLRLFRMTAAYTAVKLHTIAQRITASFTLIFNINNYLKH